MISNKLALIPAISSLFLAWLLFSILYTPIWVTFEDAFENSYEWGLFACNKCPRKFENMLWSWWEKAACEDNDDLALCQLGTDMALSANFYWYFSQITLFSLLFSSQRFFYLFMKYEIGSKIEIYAIIITGVVFYLLAVICWFVISGASFGDWSTPKRINSDIEIWVSSGAITAIVLTGLILINTVVAFFLLSQIQLPEERVLISDEWQVMRMYYKYILTVVVIILVFVFLITCAGLGFPRWIHWEYENVDFEGSLYTAKEYGDINDYPWQCVAGPAWEDNEDEYWCKTFDALYRAEYGYLSLEIVNWYLFLFWLDVIIHMYFNQVIGYSMLAYVYPILSVIFHLGAISSWFIHTEAEFKEVWNNTQSYNEKQEFWAGVGPIFAILQLIGQLLAAVLFGITFVMRDEVQFSKLEK